MGRRRATLIRWVGGDRPSLPDAAMSFIISAPSSGSGKTTVTLGLLRALSRLGPVRGAKSGPDYIDPQFHAAASGAPCPNLDAWAMPRSLIRSLAAGRTPLIIEGAMGLFDGAPPDGKGATADLARMLGLPVVLVIDASAMAQSIAPLAAGFARHDSEVRIAGVILNKVGSDRHERMLRAALAPTGLTVLGALPRSGDIKRPSRHLGLVQAGDLPDLEPFLNAAADFVSRHLDLPAIAEMLHPVGGSTPAPPPQQHKRIAIARDAAFSFTYAHQLAGWAAAGTELLPFSPLADDPVPEADMIYLPGGYPELHARRLSGAGTAFCKACKRPRDIQRFTANAAAIWCWVKR